MLTWIADADDAQTPPRFADTDHPMRKVTQGVAFHDAWDPQRRDRVAGLFDSMASSWTADHQSPERYRSLDDALDRGFADVGLDPDAQVLELGSGTGLGTELLARRFTRVAACDVSMAMLQHAPRDLAGRVRADAQALPVPSAAADLVVMVNMLLFPDEVDRVLAADGRLVWVNTVGDQTPIHLSPDDVLHALPGEWAGVASHAGTGLWLVAHRS